MGMLEHHFQYSQFKAQKTLPLFHIYKPDSQVLATNPIKGSVSKIDQKSNGIGYYSEFYKVLSNTRLTEFDSKYRTLDLSHKKINAANYYTFLLDGTIVTYLSEWGGELMHPQAFCVIKAGMVNPIIKLTKITEGSYQIFTQYPDNFPLDATPTENNKDAGMSNYNGGGRGYPWYVSPTDAVWIHYPCSIPNGLTITQGKITLMSSNSPITPHKLMLKVYTDGLTHTFPWENCGVEGVDVTPPSWTNFHVYEFDISTQLQTLVNSVNWNNGANGVYVKFTTDYAETYKAEDSSHLIFAYQSMATKPHFLPSEYRDNQTDVNQFFATYPSYPLDVGCKEGDDLNAGTNEIDLSDSIETNSIGILPDDTDFTIIECYDEISDPPFFVQIVEEKLLEKLNFYETLFEVRYSI